MVSCFGGRSHLHEGDVTWRPSCRCSRLTQFAHIRQLRLQRYRCDCDTWVTFIEAGGLWRKVGNTMRGEKWFRSLRTLAQNHESFLIHRLGTPVQDYPSIQGRQGLSDAHPLMPPIPTPLISCAFSLAARRTCPQRRCASCHLYLASDNPTGPWGYIHPSSFHKGTSPGA